MRTVVVLPTYNEVDTIERMLGALRATSPDCDILVVDDDSPDGTAERVLAHPDAGRCIRLLRRGSKDGLGGAYRSGFAWALAHGYEQVVQMDADLSHPPERVPAMLAALTQADVVVGSRYVAGGATVGWPWRRRLLSMAGNLYVRLLLSPGVRDATAGFRAWRSDALREIGVEDTDSQGYSFQLETLWRARARGLRVVEVPITFTERAAGDSKMSVSIALEAIAQVTRWWWATPGPSTPQGVPYRGGAGGAHPAA